MEQCGLVLITKKTWPQSALCSHVEYPSRIHDKAFRFVPKTKSQPSAEGSIWKGGAAAWACSDFCKKKSEQAIQSLLRLVFCCRKRYSPESLAAQWIQGFAQLVFLFFCAFFKPFPNPHIDILTKPCANRIRKKGHASAQPSFLLQSYDLLI